MTEERCWNCHVPFSRAYHHEGEMCPSCGAPPEHPPVHPPEGYHPITGHYHPEDGARPKGE